MSTEPIGLVRDLAPQGVMRAQIGQSDLAIWRSASGVVSAWENRCPHRGMRLSHGFVRGESLACAYHGWHYDCAGACHYIPAHPELQPPKTIMPTIFSVIEQAGLVWVNTVGNASPESIPKNTISVRSITLNCELDAAINAFSTVSIDENVFDEDNQARTEHATESAPKNKTQNPMMLSLDTPKTNDAIFILFQQPESHRVVAHILTRDNFTIEELISVSRWSESVRRHAENVNQSSRTL